MERERERRALELKDHTEHEHDLVRLVDSDGRLCGYYEYWQTWDLPEGIRHEGGDVLMQARPATERRLELLKGSRRNPSITQEQADKVAAEIDAIHEARLGRPKTPPKAPAPETPVEVPKNYPMGKNDRCITRDARGRYLGLYTEGEARQKWSFVSRNGAVICIGFPVDSLTTKDDVWRGERHRKTGYPPRVKHSMGQAFHYANSPRVKAIDFWRDCRNNTYNVLYNSNKPICRVPYKCLSRSFGDCWFVVSDDTVQLVALWDKEEISRRIEQAIILASEEFDVIAKPGLASKPRVISEKNIQEKSKSDQGMLKAAHGKPTSVNVTIRRRSNRPTRYVTRDENGCFLGVFTLEEAQGFWPRARKEPPIILVPQTVEFSTASVAIGQVKDYETSFSDPQYRKAVILASDYPATLVGTSTGQFWGFLRNTKLKVHNNTDEVIGRLTPQELTARFGSGWFLVSAECAQLMTVFDAETAAKMARSGEDETQRKTPSVHPTQGKSPTEFSVAVEGKAKPGASNSGPRPEGGKAKANTSTRGKRRALTFDGPDNVLYVFKGSRACEGKGHKLEGATGTLAGLNGKPIKINVNYCQNCRKYYLGLREYERYRERFGPVLGNFSFPKGFSKGSVKASALSNESPLKMCGYEVNKQVGLSARQRHLILANMMDRGILSKPRVIEYLQFFIRWREKNPSMRDACRKWNEDLDWVRNYRIDKQRRFIIADVRRGR